MVAAAPVRAEETRYELAEITFVVPDERSRPGPLLAVSELRVGSVYTGEEELEAALANGRQLLLNRRVFDGIEVSWEALEEDRNDESAARGEVPPAATPVAATFVVDDGWTVLPIPFYRYNSNSGHNPLGVLYWDNIAGTLTDFGMSFGYYSRNWVDPFGWDVRLDWNKIRWLRREWNFGIDQEYRTRERASPAGDVEFAYTEYRSRVSMSTGFRLTDRLRYSVSPRMDADYGYDTTVTNADERTPDSRVGLGFAHSIGAGRIDWHGNLRTGRSWNVKNSFSVDVRDADIAAGVGAGFRAFRLIGSRVNPGFRARVAHFFDGDVLGQGSGVRGVADNRVFGQTGLFLQTEVGLLALDIPRVLDLLVNPFFDAALPRKEGEPLTGDDVSAGTGFDFVLFPDFIRGFQGRLSIGTDLRDPGAANVEFFIVETLSF